MSEYALTAQSALGGYRESWHGIELVEMCDLAIVSIATPLDGEGKLTIALEEAFGAPLPKPGRASVSNDGMAHFLYMGSDQMFAVFDYAGLNAAKVVADKLKNAGYYTSQSDNWVGLRLSGFKYRELLERICPIDLAPSVFPEGSVARTVIEHMGVIIYRQEAEMFMLLSASSSAGSFLHAIETSINNIHLQ